MDEKQLQMLWDLHAKNGGFASFDEFKQLMNDSSARKVYFDNANTTLGFKDYNDFENTLGVSKKKVGGIAENIFQGVPSILQAGGQVGNGKAPLEKRILTDVITAKPYKVENPFAQTKEEAVTAATNKLNDIMYKEGEDWKDPLKASLTGLQKSTTPKEKAEHLGVNTLIEQSLMPDGFQAKEVLNNTIWGELNNDNLTSRALREKVGKYEKSVAPLKEIPVDEDLANASPEKKEVYSDLLGNAAIKKYAQDNPQFRKELVATGIDINDPDLFNRLPSGKRGMIMNEVLQDKDWQTYIQKENPQLAPIFEHTANNILTKNKDFGINQVANKVSQAVQKTGYNSIDPVFNFHNKGHEEMNDLVAQQVLNPQELQIWNENIKNNQAQYMDEPSLFESIAGGIKSTAKGYANTLIEPFTPISKTIEKKWEGEASNVSANPQGLMEMVRNVGHNIGMFATIAASGNVTGLGAVPNTVLAFGGDQLEQWKQKYPDKPIKAWVGATINTTLYGMLAKDIFPIGKARQAFKSVEPEVGKVAENLASGKITREAARIELNTLANRAINFGGGTIAKTGKVSLELGALTEFNRHLDRIMGMDEQEFKKYHPDDEVAKTLSSTFVGFAPIMALAKYGEMKRGNKIVEQSLYQAASNPKYFERIINDLEVKDPTIDKNDLLNNLKFLSDTKQTLDAKGIEPKNQSRYLWEAMRDKVASQTKPTEASLSKQHSEEAKTAQEVKERILAGEDADTIIPEAEQKKIDEQEETKIELERLKKDNELDNKKVDAKIESIDGRESEENRIKLQELKEEKKRINEDYQREVEKLSPKVKPEETFPEGENIPSQETIPEQQPQAISSKEEVVAKTHLDEAMAKYGWTTAKKGDDIVLINRKGKEVATIKQKGDKYTIHDNSGTKLLSGQGQLEKSAEKVAKEYFYAKENEPQTIEIHPSPEVKEPIKAEVSEVEQPTEKGTAEPPPEKPTEPVVEEKVEEPLKNKALANRLVESKNIPAEARKGIEEKGLKYEPQSHEEAATIAKEVLEQDGLDNAVLQAQAGKFGGDVNTLIQTTALDRLAELSDKEPEGAKKFEYDKKFAEIATGLDEWLRSQAGRGISALNYFYKKSPLGIVMMENAKRGEDFKQWSKPKEKSWKEFYDELRKEPEFDAIFKEEVRTELKKERAEARKTRTKKVDEFFDKAKNQFKDKGAMYSTIIPPQVITAALEGMKQAYHAGEAVVKIVQDAIDLISDKLGNPNWDKEKFRKEWEEKLRDKFTQSPLEKYKERLKGQIEALNEQINKKKRNVKVETKTELDKEAEDLTKQRDELKKQLEEIVPIKETEEYRKKLLDRYRKKLKGLPDKQKDEVIRRSFKELIENGALEFDDFKKIIGEVTGRGELTPEQVARMKELVKITNEVEVTGKKVQEERTKEALIQFHAAQLKAGKAQRELNELFNNKPDIIKRLTSIMQLNTLGIPALINNPIYNVFNQMGVRLPVGLVNDLIDRTLAAGAKLMGKPYEREWNILETQKDFFRGLGLGTKESAEQFLTGLNRQDYIQKEVYGQQIRPFRAMRDLIKHIQGKQRLSRVQVWDKSLQATAGIPAEVIARTLNLGDKPQRFAAEKAQASTFAKELGLKDMDKAIFMEFPREEAYRAYKAKGLSDVEAGKKADYVKEVIIKEGKRSTFQQDNLLNDVITRAFSVFGGKESGTANLLKSLTVSPYIKIPSNAYWSYYNIVNPEVALLQSMIHGARALSLKGKEGNASRLALREARYWLGHAVTGMAMRAVIVQMVKNGIFTPTQEDETKKEREGRAFFEPQGTVNVTKLSAWLRGEDPSKIKDGVTVSNRWFGIMGTTGNAIARKHEDMTPEQREKQDEFWNVALGGMEVDALKDLQQGVFANTSAIIQALGTGSSGFRNYSINTLNMMANIVQPAALAQISRAQLPYYSTARSDDFLKQLENSVLQRSSWLRQLTGKYPDAKMNIWGEPMLRQGSTIEKLFGINRVNKDNFAQPIYQDVKETGDIGFFPSAIAPTLGDKKLNNEQFRKLQEDVGQARKDLVAPYINDMAEIEGFGLKYSEIKDKDLKKKVLMYLYELGREEGIRKFSEEYPEFKKEALDIADEVKKAKFEVFQEINKVKTLK